MSNPYTYYLYHIPTGKKYYGVRWANEVEPEMDLWIKYFSSSKSIELLIEQYSKESFNVEIRKIFNTSEEAFAWETKVLRRIKAVQREDWLNQANFPKFRDNSGEKHPLYGKNCPKISERTTGKKNPMFGKSVYDIWLKKYGKEEADKREKVRKEKISNENTGKKHPLYGKIGKLNPNYGKRHTSKTIEKIRIKCIGKHLGNFWTAAQKIQSAKTHGFKGCWLEHKDGRYVFIENQNEFAREYNLNSGNLNGVINGIRKSHKGWRLANARI